MTNSKKPNSNFKHTSQLLIDGHSLKLEDIEPVSSQQVRVSLSDKATSQLLKSRQLVDRILDKKEIVYGITTGFGKFKDCIIEPEDSRKLQRNLILSHAAGVGPNFDCKTVRTVMLLRANALAKGYSGIRSQVVEMLLDLLNAGVHPLVPEQGSLGASGDLAPLAHLCLVLIGEGQAEYQGKLLAGADVLSRIGLSPVVLEAKEGLALLNGTQVMSALGAHLVLEAERLSTTCDLIGAMSLEAQLGSPKAFDKEIHQVRPHPGQIASATNMRLLLADSALIESHADCGLVQDAYSLRCIPQVHGASRQAFKHLREIIEIEINSATDNPLVFEDQIVSGGNFHGQPLALGLDYAAMALAELANISERRIERLVNPALSNGLPPFLIAAGGVNSGFMIAQYTAAALVSENKSLAHPACVDSIPTSANQEDHVSMGTISGRKARAILQNLYRVLAIELLCAAQGLDFRTGHAGKVFPAEPLKMNGHQGPVPLNAGPGVMAAYSEVRKRIPHLSEDRQLHLDIATAEELIRSQVLVKAAEAAVGPLL